MPSSRQKGIPKKHKRRNSKRYKSSKYSWRKDKER
jgi:hypothetical protein